MTEWPPSQPGPQYQPYQRPQPYPQQPQQPQPPRQPQPGRHRQAQAGPTFTPAPLAQPPGLAETRPQAIAPPVPPPPRALRQGWTPKQKTLVASGALVVFLLGITAIGVAAGPGSSGGGGAGAGQSADQGTSAPACYSTVTDPYGHAVTVAVAQVNLNCTSVAQFLADQFPTYRVTANAPKGPGNAVCQGMLGGAYPATVIDPTGNSEDTECLYLGFSPAP